MKTTPAQLAILAVAGFGSLVLLQILAQYRSSENFRQHMQSLKAQDLLPDIRLRRIAEENMEAIGEAQQVYHPGPIAIADEDDNGDNDN